MTYNYDASQVGVPFVRVERIVVEYPPNKLAKVIAYQTQSVVLADQTVVKISDLNPLVFDIDLPAHGNDPIQMVSPTTGANINGLTMTANQIMLGVLGAIRAQQNIQNVEPT